MGAGGWSNPIPLWIGGDPTPTELVYAALKSAMGQGGSGPPDGLRDLWLQARSQGIAAAGEAIERAALQIFPAEATDHLEVWELLLGIPQGKTLPARQDAYADALAGTLDATINGVRAALQKIDPAFEIEVIPFSDASLVQLGKAFGPLPGVAGQAFGTGQASARQSTGFPNYSDAFILRVRYFLGAGQVTPTDTTLAAAAAKLCDLLPGWIDFEMYYQDTGAEGDGFYLDQSLMDLAAF